MGPLPGHFSFQIVSLGVFYKKLCKKNRSFAAIKHADMKLNFFIAFFSLCCLTAGTVLLSGCKHEVTDSPTAEQHFYDSIVVAGVPRSFIVYQPANIQPGEKV